MPQELLSLIIFCCAVTIQAPPPYLGIRGPRPQPAQLTDAGKFSPFQVSELPQYILPQGVAPVLYRLPSGVVLPATQNAEVYPNVPIRMMEPAPAVKTQAEVLKTEAAILKPGVSTNGGDLSLNTKNIKAVTSEVSAGQADALDNLIVEGPGQPARAVQTEVKRARDYIHSTDIWQSESTAKSRTSSKISESFNNLEAKTSRKDNIEVDDLASTESSPTPTTSSQDPPRSSNAPKLRSSIPECKGPSCGMQSNCLRVCSGGINESYRDGEYDPFTWTLDLAKEMQIEERLKIPRQCLRWCL